MTDLSIREQRSRAGLSPSGREIRRGKPIDPDTVRVDGVTYQTVGGEERVDLPEREIEERREVFAEQQRQAHASVRARRQAAPLHARLMEVTDTLASFQAVRARPIAPAGRDESRDGPVLPPGGDELAVAHVDAEEVGRRFRDIEKALERLEEIVDAHRGMATARDFALMDSHEKNRVILTDFAGWHKRDVAAFEPLLGTERTIAWVRSEFAEKVLGYEVRPMCGHRKSRPCSCPGSRAPKTN